MTAVLVISLGAVAGGVHVAGGSNRPTPDPPPSADAIIGARPERCLDAQKGIRFYRAAYTANRTAMWKPGAPPRAWYDCATTRRRASEWRAKAKAAREKLVEWRAYQYDWASWLPPGWRGVARCETQTNWRHRNSEYEGAFGFAVGSWDSFVRSADPKAGPYPASAADATPRQQYEVALAIYRLYGLSGWGCRGAFYS